MSCDQSSDKLSEKLNSRLLVQEEHGFKRGHNVPPGRSSSKKAWPDRLKDGIGRCEQSMTCLRDILQRLQVAQEFLSPHDYIRFARMLSNRDVMQRTRRIKQNLKTYLCQNSKGLAPFRFQRKLLLISREWN